MRGTGDVSKIDSAPTDGLLGVPNSTAYRVHETEKHFHSRGRFWGATAAPNETNAIDANVDRPFVAVSGADDWGVAIPICGTADVPVPAGLVKTDAHRLLVTDTDHSTPYRMRLIYGAGTSAEAIAAEQWSEEMFITASGPFLSGTPVNFQMPRINVGDKLWSQAWNATNGSEVTFFWGCHGYVG